MHTYPHQPPSKSASHPSQAFTPFQLHNESSSTPEPALTGRSSSISDSSSSTTARVTSNETPATSDESLVSLDRMNPARKSQLGAHHEQAPAVIPSQAASYPLGPAPDPSQAYSQPQGSGMATPRTSTTPSAPSQAYFHDPNATPMAARTQPPPEHSPHYFPGALPSAAQAPPYAVRPVFQDQISGGEPASNPPPSHQAYAYRQQRPRDETLNIPPEQQYEDYMHNPGTLGLAAALYHDSQSQSSLLQQQQPIELMSSSSARSDVGQRQSEPPPPGPYASYNPYEQHGLVPTHGYYATDMPLVQLQGSTMSPLAAGMPTIPGFTLVHPDQMGAPMLTAASSMPPPAHPQTYAQAQGYESMTNKPTLEQRKTLRGRSRSSLRYHECSVCGKRFGRPSALQTHVYSHTGEKPYKCDIDDCARCFSVLSNLRRHQRVHHGPGLPGSPPQSAPHYSSHPSSQHHEKDF